MLLSSATGSYGYPCLSWYSEKGGRFITRIPKRPKQILQNGGITNIYCIWYLLTPRPKSTLCWTHKDFFFLLLTGTMIHLVIRVHRMDTRRERGGRSLFWCTPLPSLPTTQSPWLTPHTTGWAAVGSLQPPGAPCGCFSPQGRTPQSSQLPLWTLCLSEGARTGHSPGGLNLSEETQQGSGCGLVGVSLKVSPFLHFLRPQVVAVLC